MSSRLVIWPLLLMIVVVAPLLVWGTRAFVRFVRREQWGTRAARSLRSLAVYGCVMLLLGGAAFSLARRADFTKPFRAKPLQASLEDVLEDHSPRGVLHTAGEEYSDGKDDEAVPEKSEELLVKLKALPGEPDVSLAEAVPLDGPASYRRIGELPSWVHEGLVRESGVTRFVLSSGRFATIEEAEEQLAPVVRKAVLAWFHESNPDYGRWELSDEVLKQHLVHQRYVEKTVHDFGRVTGEMYRLHLQVALGPALRETLTESWQQQTSVRRLKSLGGLSLFATFILATFAGYFRLDSRLQGRARNRLKVLAAAVILAGGVATGYAFGGEWPTGGSCAPTESREYRCDAR